MENLLRISAPAKINLYLKIIGRRSNGYHDLATLMQKIQLCDELLLQPCGEGIHLQCPDSELPENKNNLVYRAAELFFSSMEKRLVGKNRGARLTLFKKIPVAAGLGGGSSDAAAVLLGLDRIFETNCTVAELISLAVKLGADVPFFVFNHSAAWATGVGEKLKPAVALADYDILLVNPDFFVSTKWVFETFALTFVEKINNLSSSQKESDVSTFGTIFSSRAIQPMEIENDLESITAEKYSEINTLKRILLDYGAVASMMSGSGPTVFGLFLKNSSSEADKCFNELKERYNNTFFVQPIL